MDQKSLTPEEKQKIDDFAADIKTVCIKFKLDLVPTLQITEQGIIPVFKIVPIDETKNKEESLKKE